MKNLILAAAPLVAAALMLGSLPAHAGFDSGNAGDALSAEFIYTGRDVLQRLELSASAGKPIIDTKKLRVAMETTEVISKDKVVLRGEERDAVNYPSRKLIEISRPRWKEYRKTSETHARLKVVLHEYLWMTGVDDTNYVQSEPIIRALNVPNYSPSIWQNLPGTAFAVVECTGQAKDGSFVTVAVQTKGASNSPDRAEVRIERDGNKFGYRFNSQDISQFFESDDEKANTAMVGLGAYVNKEFPVAIKYSGTNYIDMDLKAVIEAGGIESHGNSMRVWRGPGFGADELYSLTAPVCSVWSNN
jgi:hypothetical protein